MKFYHWAPFRQFSQVRAACKEYLQKFCFTAFPILFLGKKAIWKRVAGCKEAIKLLNEATIESLETFVIRYIYNDRNSGTLAQMRKRIWTRTKNKNRKTLARIGPDKISNDLRTKRVQYHIRFLESFTDPIEAENPLDNGYVWINGSCVPRKSDEPALPLTLRNANDCDGNENQKENDDNEEEVEEDDDYDESFDEEVELSKNGSSDEDVSDSEN